MRDSAHISREGIGRYRANYELSDLNGFGFSGDSSAILYTGYEWRGSATIANREVREVYAVSNDGERISGRWFDAEHDEEGGDWVAIRQSGAPQIAAIFPKSLRAGTTTTVTIIGRGLALHGSPTISFGDSAVISRVKNDPQGIHLDVSVASMRCPGCWPSTSTAHGARSPSIER